MDITIVFQIKLLYILNILLLVFQNVSTCITTQRAIDKAKERRNSRLVNIRNQLPSSVGVSQDSLPKLLEEYISGKNNEDINLNILQLMQKYGYTPEIHHVKTQDEYILTMFRIPRNGSVVFLMHGLLCSADDWVTAGPESSIAYLLADQGYDVWLGNARGNKHSRRHEKLSPDSSEFWNFSWDEIGRYDLPAMIDYVLNITAQIQLNYVGHSQGTTSFFVMCSERPEYNKKISLMIALSAVAWMSHLESPLIRFISPLNPFLNLAIKLFGVNEFAPSNTFINSLMRTFCGEEILAKTLCSNVMFIICGYDKEQLNVTNLPVLLTHMPAGAATKQLVHYGQEVVSGNFQKFDYGGKKNKEVYGSTKPPDYPVGKITAPVAIFCSKNDWLASVTDVEILRSKLKNVVEYYEVPFEKFNHLDFIWAKDVKELIVEKLLQLLKVY